MNKYARYHSLHEREMNGYKWTADVHDVGIIGCV